MKKKSAMRLPKRIDVDLDGNTLLSKVLELVNSNEEILTLWKITNVTAIKRLGMTDHGILHFNIVANNALKMARLLERKGVVFSVCRDYGLGIAEAEVVILLTALFHDLGMSVHRAGHEEFSLFLANRLLHELFAFLPVSTRTIMTSEVLHAIIGHRADGQPLTVEAGVVRVADALDMSEGRSRFPYDDAKLDIHSVSARAIDEIVIHAGRKRPIQVDIVMNHTAGIFQVDELLKRKVRGSGVEQYIEIKVFMDKGRGKQLFKDFYEK